MRKLRLLISSFVQQDIYYLAISFLFSTNILITAQEYSLGIGKYPGNPQENYAPTIKHDKTTYRNIAFLRPIYGSSSYDFYLTPQLLTDGIIETQLPGWLVTSSIKESYTRSDREKFLDRNISSRNNFVGNNFWVQVEMAGNYILPEVNGFRLSGAVYIDTTQNEIRQWTIKIVGSNDGKDWLDVGAISKNGIIGDTLIGNRRKIYSQNYRLFNEILEINNSVKYKFYKAELNSPNVEMWRLGDFLLLNNGETCAIGGPYLFSSAWKSMGFKNEWVYVDFGAVSLFDKINLFWLKGSESGSIQISNDAKNWETICELSKNSISKEIIILDKKYKARYLRLNLDIASYPEDGFILSELEVYGTGSTYAVAHSQAKPDSFGNIRLSGGNWKLQRVSFVNDVMDEISRSGYDDQNWIVATVPGTVLVSYLNNGMIPDPDYVDNQFLISDSYFYSDFIYRNEFIVPNSYKHGKVFLNFDGINWKADVYLNGKAVGTINGAFIRGKFDVTRHIVHGKSNALAVYIYKNNSPGFVKEPTFVTHQANGGELGADNPTFHASVGWDWLPSIRGRNIGIWNDVYLSASGDVTIEDPYISSSLPLPDTTSAELKIEVTLSNHNDDFVSGTLFGEIGKISFNTFVSFSPSEKKIIVIDPLTNPILKISNPKLWWPNGYGMQNLYEVKLKFVTSDGRISDIKKFKTGIRKITYSEEGGKLKIWINGKRFIARGGNWGFSESNLRYRAREYDIAARYHKDMNFNMLRNWVGQTGDDEFFEACDKYGLLIWQDFWLANPGDGPNPNDNQLFLENAEDFIKRIRLHPSVGLFCGRNEGYPPENIDKSIRKLLTLLVPDIHYISSSADEVVSGHGPYSLKAPKYYFKEKATPKFHSEIGLPAPVSYESLRMMMPDSLLWPINLMWGIHDFSMDSAQEGENFIRALENNFGKIDNAKEWLEYAQWLNYQGYRAILEAQSKSRMGVLFWMTHCAWPSLVFQTYDYYFEPTGAYFGSKKGSEPLHIQWNALTDSIEVINHSIPDGNNMRATIELLNIDGEVKFKRDFVIDCAIDQVKRICKLEQPEGLSPTYFIRLKLEKKNQLVSENFYWNSMLEENYQDISKLAKVKLDIKTKSIQKSGKWFLICEIGNHTKTPAPMVRLIVVGSKDKERILPVIYSDNFLWLMPGEKRKVEIEINNVDTRGNKPIVEARGINIE